MSPTQQEPPSSHGGARSLYSKEKKESLRGSDSRLAPSLDKNRDLQEDEAPIAPTPAPVYSVGVGKSEITDGAKGIGLQGWADGNQKTNDSPYQRIYARAYFMEDEAGTLAAMVCTDNWAATDRVKREVLERVGALMELDNSNFMLMASHAHSAPGGYSDYKLYENQVGGYDAHNFECIVAGIVAALEQAKESMKPGNIYFNEQDITSVAGGEQTDVGEQRSLPAYDRNHDTNDFEAAVDHRMWLLKFTQGEADSEYTVGMINWYAIHPTSLVSKQSSRPVGKPSPPATILPNPEYFVLFCRANTTRELPETTKGLLASSLRKKIQESLQRLPILMLVMSLETWPSPRAS